MKDLPKVTLIALFIVILSLSFFYFYFFKLDLVKLKSTLKREVKKGDIVLFVPDWEKNDILSLDGLPIITSLENQYLNLYTFRHLFVVKNTSHYKNTAFPLLNEVLLDRGFNIGRYRIEKYRLPDFNLSEYMESLKVYLKSEEDKRECVKEKGIYRCGEMGWQYVGLADVDVNGQKAECIWAHPIGGKTIVIESEIIPKIAGRFFMYSALASTSGFDSNKPEVKTSLFINGKLALTTSISNRREWIKKSFSSGLERPKDLRIEIFSEREYKNHFCFNIEAF